MDPVQMPPQSMNGETPSKVHIWILALLAWTAVFSLIAVGLLVARESNDGLSETEMSSACQNGVLNGITTNLTRISEACVDGITQPEEEIQNLSFDAVSSNGTLPSLSIPLHWTASWSLGLFSDKKLAEFRAVKGIYETCTECGGLDNPPTFTIKSLPASEADAMDPETIKNAYIESSKADDVEYTNIVVASYILKNGTLILIDGVEDIQAAGARNGVFHIMRFLTTNTYVELDFHEHGATSNEWLTVKDSLDWSTMK